MTSKHQQLKRWRFEAADLLKKVRTITQDQVLNQCDDSLEVIPACSDEEWDLLEEVFSKVSELRTLLEKRGVDR